MKYKILSVLSGLLFASYPTLSKVVLERNSPLMIILITTLISSLLVLSFYGLYPEFKKFSKLKMKNTAFLVIALCSGIAGPLLILFGLQQSSVMNMVVILSLQAPFEALLSSLVLKEKLGMRYGVGLGILIFGIIVYATHLFQVSLILRQADMFFFLSVLFYSTSDVVYKKYLAHVSHEMIIIGRNLFAAVILLTGFLILSYEQIVSLSLETSDMFYLGLIILFPILGAQYLWYTSLDHINVSDAASIISLYPIFAGMIAFVFLRETLNPLQLVGVLIAFAGLLICQVHRKTKKPHHVIMAMQGVKQY